MATELASFDWPPAPEAPALGLTAPEVLRNRRQHGANLFPKTNRSSPWAQLARQMVHFFAIMLWVAGLLAIIAGLPQLGVAIFIIILINGSFAFLQEYRADKALERLSELIPRRAVVVRDGIRQEIDVEDLVAGDIVVLGAGDRVPADITALKAEATTVDMSTLTGESVPMVARAGDALFAGTFITNGDVIGRVTTVGRLTRLGQIAALAAKAQRPRAPLALELDRVVRYIAVFSCIVGGVFLAIAMLVGIRFSDGLIFAIGVTVALVPEGLLPTVSLSLAMGAQRMGKRMALVRKLESVETLGSTTYICVDKTGTLTRNEMNVVEVWTPQGTARIRGEGYGPSADVLFDTGCEQAVKLATLAAVRASLGRTVLKNAQWHPIGDRMEAAIHALALRLGLDLEQEQRKHPERKRFPFDSQRRRTSAVVDSTVLMKGAPDSIIPICSSEPSPAADEMARRGLRVLAVACRQLDPGETVDSPEQAERAMQLLGFIGISDPPRPQVEEAIRSCRSAGIRVTMLTGDQSGTAWTVAEQVGLLCETSLRLEGQDLPQDDAVLGAILDRDGVVVARVSPEDKLRIARSLRARGHVVAMTGDGVNDGPALREANIGIAMGKSGTDVAREAADLVLLDDQFGTIVAAIEEGRATFANVRRFLTYHLTDNVAELAPFVVWVLSGGRFPLAIGILQVLSLDIGTDMLPAVALGAEPPRAGLLQRLPDKHHIMDRAVLLRAFGLLGPTEAVIELMAFVVSFWAAGWRPGMPFPSGPVLMAASGAAFAAVVFGQMANAFACRSTRYWPGRLGWTTNRLLLLAVFIEMCLLASFFAVPWLAATLHHRHPSLPGLICALLAVPAVFTADAAYKRLFFAADRPAA